MHASALGASDTLFLPHRDEVLLACLLVRESRYEVVQFHFTIILYDTKIVLQFDSFCQICKILKLFSLEHKKNAPVKYDRSNYQTGERERLFGVVYDIDFFDFPRFHVEFMYMFFNYMFLSESFFHDNPLTF